jgi:trans-aconitate methyltransferase
MNDHLIHSPLAPQNVHKALDIGCGTGAMTHRIASEFPHAKVYGLDLSPVPNIREKLPNIEYIQANFNDITGPEEPDARFKPASFDYLFSRLLLLGMTDWPGYVARTVALVRPGVRQHEQSHLLGADKDPRAGLKCTI